MSAIKKLAIEPGWTNLRDLMEHIVETCHDELRMIAPELDESAERIGQSEDLPADLRDELQMELAVLADLLETHIAEQENWLFPTVRHLGDLAGATEISVDLGEGIESLMERVADEHRQMQASLERINACLGSSGAEKLGSRKDELCERLRVVGEHLPTHDHLETDVLFPWISRTLKQEGFTNDGLFW
jgi:iron-sulfur cluster repair protein YtfE (RIC family)